MLLATVPPMRLLLIVIILPRTGCEYTSLIPKEPVLEVEAEIPPRLLPLILIFEKLAPPPVRKTQKVEADVPELVIDMTPVAVWEPIVLFRTLK